MFESFPVPLQRAHKPRDLTKSPNQGVALVLVLAVVVLILALALAFLTRTSLEHSAARSYRSSSEARAYADTVVSIVQAQINYASTEKVAGQPVAWASQPGMVRTFDQDGNLHQAYKLYSDTEMVSDTVDSALMVTALNDWMANTAHFTDLNAPVRGNYPILDPAAVGKILGFRLENPPDASPTQLAPMPVRWLYILKDGQIKGPTGTGHTAAIPGATKDNPIVGRIAFWTDDETAKLNINTASEGGFWDIPRAFSFEERDRMARFQPALREFQRYPGHPATTSLFPVLGYKFGGNEIALKDFLYGSGTNSGITPRIQEGGSLNGTRKATEPVNLDTARLYSSVDEMIFGPERNLNQTLKRDDLEKIRFFLTTHSRAPEVNLFHLPRMVTWPVNAGVKHPSALDKLIAFCGTINSIPYYLKREEPDSPTADYSTIPSNQNLYRYIGDLMKRDIPGFGSTSFAEKFSQSETDQIETEIFDYIRSSNIFCTTLNADPFTPKTPPAGNPRSAVAMKASRAGQVTPLSVGDTKGFGRLPVLSKAILQFYVCGATSPDGSTQYIPTIPPDRNTPKIANTPAMSLPSIGEPIQFQTRAVIYFDTFDPNQGYPYPRYNFDLVVTFPSGSWQVTRSGGGPQQLTWRPSVLPIRCDPLEAYDAKTAEGRGGQRQYSIWFGRYLGGPQGPLWIMQNFVRGLGSTSGQYPLVTDPVNLLPPINTISDEATPPAPALPDPPTVTDTFSFSGGRVNVKLRVGSEIVQSYDFDFPPFSGKPLPLYPGPQRGDGSASASLPTQLKQAVISADFRHRLIGDVGTHRGVNLTSPDDQYNYCDLRVVQPNDVVVSLEPAYGDKRLLGGRKNLRTASSYVSGTPARVGAAVASFVPHENYAGPMRHAHSLRTSPFNLEPLPGPVESRPGRILNLIYGRNAAPDVPTRYHGGVPTFDSSGAVASFPPDFDNGTMHIPDDAYVNRADEGSAEDQLSGTGATSSGSAGRQFAWYVDSIGNYQITSSTFYSPNKQMPSAAMFGSLPTGVVRDLPWQTLLFRPDPGGHPGAESPPDYLLLDLFWMPVVEPYAISEPFSTAGKVNINYQVMPFTYIKRESSLLGLLQSEELMSIRNSEAYRGGVNGAFGTTDEYKMFSAGGDPNAFSSKNFRVKIDGSETLKAFEKRFSANKIFISETEICSLPLIPVGESYSENFEQDYWSGRRLTGDNSREIPYVHLLPRVTTKSNTYTIHYRVQALQQKPNRTASEWSEWREDSDAIVSEYRGSTTLERFIDPNNKSIPDYTTTGEPSSPTLDDFYRWRTLSTKQFAP